MTAPDSWFLLSIVSQGSLLFLHLTSQHLPRKLLSFLTPNPPHLHRLDQTTIVERPSPLFDHFHFYPLKTLHQPIVPAPPLVQSQHSPVLSRQTREPPTLPPQSIIPLLNLFQDPVCLRQSTSTPHPPYSREDEQLSPSNSSKVLRQIVKLPSLLHLPDLLRPPPRS